MINGEKNRTTGIEKGQPPWIGATDPNSKKPQSAIRANSRAPNNLI
jgi:hypothetical protein